MSGRPAGIRLTAREREIATLIGHGLTNKEIAIRLKIAQRTADAHVQNMLNKLGASNRAQIVALAGAARADPAPAIMVPPAAIRRANVPWASTRIALLLAFVLTLAVLMPADHRIGPAITAAADRGAATSDQSINDAFADTDLDTSIWDVGSSDRVYVAENAGHLGIYVAGGAADNFNAAVSTVCRAHGDFDARVAFELVRWREGDSVVVSLMGAGTPFNTYRTSATRPDSYGAYLPPGGREVKAVGTTGTLRLSRVGPKWSGYYLVGDRWSWIASGTGPIVDIGLSIAVFNAADAAPFGGAEALVYFRNFHVVADRIICS